MKTIRLRSCMVVGFVSAISLIVSIMIISTPVFAKTNSNGEVKRAVPFSEVNVDDGFLHDYMKLVICNVIPTAINNVSKDTGGIPNIENCAKWHSGEIKDRPNPMGAKYVDSDVHKVLESMCMALDTPSYGDPDIEKAQAQIKATLEKWIPWYQKAPEQEGELKGYFDTFYSLTPSKAEDPEKGYDRYTNVDNHELYCQGHFMEAAVAHYRYMKNKEGKDDFRLLDVAINSADHISKTFGESKRKQMPGHEEIELALLKLAKLCQEIGGEYAAKAQGYIDTAAFFLEVRGNYEGRAADIAPDKRIYYQDHQPVSKQTEAVGHAVRAQYLYTGMCELASIDSNYAKKYDNALKSLWDDVTNKKQYVTGGIGDQSNNNEGFADAYYLPNYTSYCETCAGVANMLWNRSMSTLYDGAQYADQIETDLYNNVLGHINFDGNKFYYQNRICSKEAYSRSDWFGTACCPPNFTRTILQLGGYVYNTTSNDIYVNQYISNKASFNVDDNVVNVELDSDFPYNASGKMTITPNEEDNFNLQLRKPSWSGNYNIKIDGKTITPEEKDGYIVISGQNWKKIGTIIEFNFDMPLKYVKTDDRVETNQGLVALRHGPLLYCAEGCDNDKSFNYNKASIDINGTYNFEYVDSLDGKDNPFKVRSVYALNHSGKVINGDKIENITWRLVPYYARCNREPDTGMRVFLRDGDQPIKTHQKATASASYTNKTDTVEALNDGSSDKDVRWTTWISDTEVAPSPWAQYEFDSPVSFKGFKIYWYDDKGGVRYPDGFKITVYNKVNNTSEEIPFENISNQILSNDDKFKTYIFPKTYTGDTIRMTIDNSKSQHAVGIVEWELIDAEQTNVLDSIDITKQPNKTEYIIDESFDPTGMVVQANYIDQSGKKTTKEITDYTYSPQTFSKAGKQAITISYTENNITKTADITVDVKEKAAPTPINPDVKPDVNPDINPNPNMPSDNQQTDIFQTVATGDNLLLTILLIAIIAVTLAFAITIGVSIKHFTKQTTFKK